MEDQVFVNIHAHSYYSLSDSISSPEDIVRKTKELGGNCATLSDHGNLSGHFEFREACKKHNIKPIYGVEAYFMEDITVIHTINDGLEELKERRKAATKDKELRKQLDEMIEKAKAYKKEAMAYNHLILLAKNAEGYRNLVKIQNDAVLDGFHGKPRCDWKILERHIGGLIASSACLGGRISKDIKADDMQKAKLDIARFKSIFGEDDFYLELQLHDIKLQTKTNHALIKLAEETNTQLSLALDSHYTEPDEAYTRGLIYSLSKKTKDTALKESQNKEEVVEETEEEKILIASEEEEDYNDGVLTDLYIKNDVMLLEAWRKYMPGTSASILAKAIRNTRGIERKVETFELDTSLKFPIFDVGEDTQEDYLSKIAWEGLAKKGFGNNPVYVERLKMELKTVNKLGFAGYFNVVGDMIQHAKKHQPVGLSRGSAGGSLLAYCIDITAVNPIEYELVFERFLSPEKGILAPTFGIPDLSKVQLDHNAIESNCTCNQKH